MEPKIDLEKLLNDGAIIRIKPQGYSMYPLFIPGRDEALIQQIPIGYLQRNAMCSIVEHIAFLFCTEFMLSLLPVFLWLETINLSLKVQFSRNRSRES